MGLIGALPDADLAVDAQVLIPDNGEVVVVSVDGLEKQVRYLVPNGFGETRTGPLAATCQAGKGAI
jgi:hypothetical protein